MKENILKKVFVSVIASLCLVNNNILANNNISLEKDYTQEDSLQEPDNELAKLKKSQKLREKSSAVKKFVNVAKPLLLWTPSIVSCVRVIRKAVKWCENAENKLEGLQFQEYVRENHLYSENKSGVDKEGSEKNVVVDEKLDQACELACETAQSRDVVSILKSVHNYINTVSKTNDVITKDFIIFDLPEIHVIARLYDFYHKLKREEILKETDFPEFMKSGNYSAFDDLKLLSGEKRVYTFLNKLYELFPSVFINPVLDRFSCEHYFNALDDYLIL